MRLNFVLAESALELVPKEIRGSPAVRSDSRRRGVDPSRILLDRSFHHAAMGRLRESEKRGRPDLVHAVLLNVTGTPLFLDGMLRVFVHTSADVVLEVGDGTRMPKSYLRFRGVAEKLLVEKPREGLVKAYDEDFAGLIRRVVRPDLVVGLSTQGRQTTPEKLAETLVAAKNPCVVVGGFPHGHFAPKTLLEMDELARVHSRPLEAHVVAARVVYEVEKTLARTND